MLSTLISVCCCSGIWLACATTVKPVQNLLIALQIYFFAIFIWVNLGFNVREGNQITFCWPWEGKVTSGYFQLFRHFKNVSCWSHWKHPLSSALRAPCWNILCGNILLSLILIFLPSFSQNLKNLKTNHDALLAKGDELNVQLKEERLKSFHLQKELQSVTISNRRTEEVRLCSRDLQSAWATYT